MQKYGVIGVMSGTSLDGLDIAYVEFYFENTKWHFKSGPYITVPYSEFWKNKLRGLKQSSALDYCQLHTKFGHFVGENVYNFISQNKLGPRLIASHGHTVFHQPENTFTSQLGDGSAIAVKTGVCVVSDFRSMDVARGGQGAPLVPLGDTLLFGDYPLRINMGGFSNISIGELDKLKAYDICPVNIVLNALAGRLGMVYDKHGQTAQNGCLLPRLLHQLNQLEFYKRSAPKSLGIEWVEREVFPLLSTFYQTEDLLRTFTEHVAIQISKTIGPYALPGDRVLFTGGGVYNSFLMERIDHHTKAYIEIPAADIIEMKEAIIFAFLGLLRYLGEENISALYTGASKNSISGALYHS
jgi:anhydro-N-acetylmuramic acid kinase